MSRLDISVSASHKACIERLKVYCTIHNLSVSDMACRAIKDMLDNMEGSPIRGTYDLSNKSVGELVEIDRSLEVLRRRIIDEMAGTD